MWPALFARIAMLAAVAAEPGQAAQSEQTSAPASIATRQTYFSIPFRIDRIDPRLPAPATVEMYVSTDFAAHWRKYGSVEPSKASFLFRAGGDGEYWFFIRTIDASGRARPEGPPRPGLRVTVDTTAPRLQLEAIRGDVGQVVARWRASDSNLRPESLSIQYRSGASQTWQPVTIDRRLARPTDPVWGGDVTWWPQPASERIEVRAEVADTAGNRAVSHAQAAIPGQAAMPPKPVPNDGPILGLRGRPVSAERPVANSAGPVLEGPITSAPRESSPGGVVFQSPQGSVAIQIHPPVGSQYKPPERSLGKSPHMAGVPPGEKIRMVNSLRFELEYELQSVGPSGVAKVELFGTRDGGRTWTSFGVDEDKRSPFAVSVKEEGVYGFRVAVRSGAGLGGELPRPGALPDLWIGVDLTKPRARILGADQMPGDKAGQLRIRWEADDWLLAARPINLLYSPSPGGPWLPIANGLENTGEHTWIIDLRVPERIFLRLEVQDEAGNLGIFEAPEPITLDQRRPEVRVRSVRPLGS